MLLKNPIASDYMQVKEKNVGLYIHIPFCKSKCYYCDFNSFAGKDSSIPQYFNALRQEIEFYSDRLKGYIVKTIFIGGGTPSFVDPDYICKILNQCSAIFHIDKEAEISIEANPGTLSYEKLSSYVAAGINRLSIGLQAWQNNLLKKIGRIHNIDEFIENFRQARKAGFKNINVDLIFGIPGQTLKDWAETVDNVIKLGAEHISCYSLKIEKDTVLYKGVENGTIQPVEDELDREMYHLAIDILVKSNYKHYEISNFAKAEYECRHNLIYWNTERYLGLGAGVHSYFDRKRFNNIYSIEDYVSCIVNRRLHVENIQEIGKKDEMSEFIILGLRLVDGISITRFKEKFDEGPLELFKTQIDILLKKQLIELQGGRIKLTPAGLDLANQVFVEFI